MKLAAVLLWMVTTSATSGSTFSYPTERKPEVSLVEAYEIAAAMLKSRNEDARYHGIQAELWGDEDPGDGGWNIWFADKDGNRAVARIPLRGKVCFLIYQRTKGEAREVHAIKFTRDGNKVSAPAEDSEKSK